MVGRARMAIGDGRARMAIGDERTRRLNDARRDTSAVDYVTKARGVDRLVFEHSILDLTPYGRQEDWEDSPAGWPQAPHLRPMSRGTMVA